MRDFCFTFFVLMNFTTQGKSQNFEHWKLERKEELLSEDGWINLIDLVWFDESSPFLNKINKDSLLISDQITGKNIGTFQFLNDSIWFFFNPAVSKNELNPSSKILQFPVSDYS